MKYAAVPVLTLALAAALLPSCQKKPNIPVFTDSEAISNYIEDQLAYYFNFDIVDTTFPDTSYAARPTCYREITDSSTSYNYRFDWPDPNQTYDLPTAEASVVRTLEGRFHSFVIDSLGRKVDISKPFSERFTINATFTKFGEDYDAYKGWVISDIGGVTGGSVPSGRSFGQISISSQYGADYTETEGTVSSPDAKYELLAFGKSESLEITFAPGDSTDLAFFHEYTSSSYHRERLRPDSTGAITFSTVTPATEGRYHLSLELISDSTLYSPDTTIFDTKLIGILYEVE